MNKLIKTIPLLVALLSLNACKKDDITVEKNESTSWEIDKNIVDNDIRTRLGYDPREQQAYFYKPEADLPMVSFSDIPITRNNTVTVTVRLTQKVEEDTNVTLTYDASLFEKVKANYPGFELGNLDLLQIAPSQATVLKGTNFANFVFATPNDTSFNKKVILPFALSFPNNSLKILKESDVFVIKIFPEQISLSIDNQGISRNVKVNAINNNISIDNEEVSFTISANAPIPEGVVLGLVRDESVTQGVAPIGTESSISKIEGTQGVRFIFKIENLEALKREGRYVLPFKLVLYDAQGIAHATSIAPKVYIITKKEYPNNNVETTHSSSVPSGDKIDNVTGDFVNFFNFDSQDFGNIIDGNENTFGSFSNEFDSQSLNFEFGATKKLKTIRIKMANDTPVNSIRVSITNDAIFIGNATFTKNENWYIITLKNALEVSAVQLSDFRKDGEGATFKIHEVEFYEEE